MNYTAEVLRSMALAKRRTVHLCLIMQIGETYSKPTQMPPQIKMTWVLYWTLKIRSMVTCNQISLIKRTKITSHLMIPLLRKQVLALMPTGQLKEVMPKWLTRVIDKTHTERNKPNYHHRYLNRLITQSINLWTSPSLMLTTLQISKDKIITCTLISLEGTLLVLNHKRILA